MATLEIKQFGDPVLRKTAKPVLRVNNAVRKILDDMLETMRMSAGAGLAAPQVGVCKRMVVVDVGEGPHFLVNPEVVSVSGETQTGMEGCLSWPGYVGEVERPLRATVRALDRDGHELWVEGEGYLARALLHEIDHLDGVLYVDRASTISEVKKDEAAGDDEGDDTQDGGTRCLTAVFMGSPEFAVPTLDEMINAGIDVRLVVTQPDRPFGRRRELKATPVKEHAMKLGIPVIACERVSSPEVTARIRDTAPDFLVVAAFGQKLPSSLLTAPAVACLNVHPSLLPKYRGGNPIQRAVMNGDAETGVSVIHLSEKMDAGDIALQKTVEIGQDETFGTLEKRLSALGAHALVDAVCQIASGAAPRIPQEESLASFAKHLSKGEDVIDWGLPRRAVHNLVRGLSPRPGAVTYAGCERIKIWETRVLSAPAGRTGVPGEIAGADGDAVIVMCGDGPLAVMELQPDGGKPMGAKAFMAGRKSLGSFSNGRDQA